MERILELDPVRVLFAHDQVVWEPAWGPDRHSMRPPRARG
jgi:hypothetical protein